MYSAVLYAGYLFSDKISLGLGSCAYHRYLTRRVKTLR